MTYTLGRIKEVHPGEIKNSAVYVRELDTDELLVGTPTVEVAVDSGDGAVENVTVAGQAVNTEATRIAGALRAAGKAIVWVTTITADAVNDTIYKLTWSCETDAGNTLSDYEFIRVKTR